MIQFNTLFPLYVSDKLEALKTFYTTEFGFDAAFFDPDFYLHLQHPGNGAQLGFLLPEHASQPSFLQARAQCEGQVITFEVSHARQALASAEEAGLDVFHPYKEEPWGQNHFMLRDPAGFILDIVENTN